MATSTGKPGPRPGSRRVEGGNGREYWYVGVVRIGRKALVECGHQHTNRDWPGRHGTSATGCAREIIDGAARPETAEHYAQRRRQAWTALTRTAGHTHTAGTVQAAKDTAAANALEYLAAVDIVRAATADQEQK